MGEEMIIKMLAEVGAPLAVCLYTLYGVNRSLKELTTVVQDQNKILEALKNGLSQIERLDNDVKEVKFRLEAMSNAKA